MINFRKYAYITVGKMGALKPCFKEVDILDLIHSNSNVFSPNITNSETAADHEVGLENQKRQRTILRVQGHFPDKRFRVFFLFPHKKNFTKIGMWYITCPACQHYSDVGIINKFKKESYKNIKKRIFYNINFIFFMATFKVETNKKLIFLVDDNLMQLSTGQAALQPQYTVITIPSGEKLLLILKKTKPDLILLDVEMPNMNGYDVIKNIKANPETADIPVIFLTGKNDEDNEFLGLSLGAVDYIIKPFSKPILLKRVEQQLTLKAFTDNLEKMVEERTEKIQRLQNGIIFVLADTVENRDENTGGHIERTTSYLKILIDAMLDQGIYADEIRDLDIDLLISSSRLHDAGKITISDVILNKPGKLTDEEFSIMKNHAAEGERIINQIVSRTEDGDFLHNARLFAGYHHERWDGKGYPYGLGGEKIPIQGRIMAIADVYDALISERPYKKALKHEDAMKIIFEGRGTQFDPYLTDLFMSLSDKIKEVSEAV